MDTTDNISNLITQFIMHGEGKTAASRKMDVKIFNKHADAIFKIVTELKNLTPSGLPALLPLMQHEDPYVRLSASYHCLALNREEAVKFIRDLAYGENIARDTAYSILRYIEEG